MPRPIPVPVRQAIWRRLCDGQDGPTLAAVLGLAPRPVRELIRRFRLKGQAAVMPAYGGCGAATPKPPEARVQAALSLRRDHPSWGAGLIRVMLRRQHPRDPLPAVRTLRRWFLRAGLAPAPAGRRPKAETRRAERPHEVWPRDAAEQVPLQTGQKVSWPRIADEGLDHRLSHRSGNQAAERFRVERGAAGRAGTSSRSRTSSNRSWGLAPKKRSAAVVPSGRRIR